MWLLFAWGLLADGALIAHQGNQGCRVVFDVLPYEESLQPTCRPQVSKNDLQFGGVLCLSL